MSLSFSKEFVLKSNELEPVMPEEWRAPTQCAPWPWVITCQMPYLYGKSDGTTESSDLLQTLVKISEYIFSSSIAVFSNVVATCTICGYLNVS